VDYISDADQTGSSEDLRTISVIGVRAVMKIALASHQSALTRRLRHERSFSVRAQIL
jgi:hypothetical protein